MKSENARRFNYFLERSRDKIRDPRLRRARDERGWAGLRVPTEREFAYDCKSHIGKLDKALDEANTKGWTVADMKKDWKTIFLFSQRRPRSLRRLLKNDSECFDELNMNENSNIPPLVLSNVEGFLFDVE